MKILMVAEGYVPVPPTKYGGTERVIYYLIKGLVDRGHEVTLLASGDSDVPCRLIPVTPKHTFFGKNDAEQAKIEKKIEKIRAYTKELIHKEMKTHDILHSHGFDLIEFQDYPTVTTLHNMLMVEFWGPEYFDKRRNLNFITVSENQQEPLPELNYVGVCYNGEDDSEFPYEANPDDYIAFIGRFDEDKNPHLAIDLALKLNMKIKLAGKTDYKGKRYFEEKIKPHLDNPLVEYWGEIGHEEKVKLLSKAKVNLHPTNFREPFGLTVLEAAYMGTPTLAIRRGSMPELIEDGRTGVLVEDFDQGYHEIQKCFTLDREYISKRARLLFNYKTMAKQYEIAYKHVLDIYNEQHSHHKKVLEKTFNTRTVLNLAWKTKGEN
jgi:glycosyltransferase involved in cell wall biosynthesis